MGSSVGLHVRVVVQGELGPTWSAMFADLAVESSLRGTTHITGELPDQAAFHGLLDVIRDLGISLISAEARATSRDGRPASAPSRSMHGG